MDLLLLEGKQLEFELKAMEFGRYSIGMYF